MRLDALAASPTGRVLHIVREFNFTGDRTEFRPLCRPYGPWWPTTWDEVVSTDTEYPGSVADDGRPVCAKCYDTARWLVDLQCARLEAARLSIPSRR